MPRLTEPGHLSLDVPNAIQVSPDTESTGRRRELSRRPKALDSMPSLFLGGSGGIPIPAGTRSDDGGALPPHGAPSGTPTVMVAHSAELHDLDEVLEKAEPDIAAATMMRQIATNLSVRRRQIRTTTGVSGGNPVPLPYRYRSDEIDLDRTLAVLVENPRPEASELIVRERCRSTRAAVLVLDVSGSMKGEKARMAAATVGALASEFRDDQVAVVAFWSDAALVKPLDLDMPVGHLLDRLLRMPSRGLTNVAFALDVAAAELRRSAARRKVAVLLTDALHNAGPDPRDLAARLPELHVLAQVDGSHDLPLAGELARAGHGRLAPVRTYRDVAPALNQLLAE